MQKINYILPSEAQQAIFHFGLREKYFDTNFKKYTVEDFGVEKFERLLMKDRKFQKNLLKRKIRKYAEPRYFEMWLSRLRKNVFVFYDENEVIEWIYANVRNR